MTTTVVEADGRRVEITHPGKPLFPADGITKLDLAEYYRDVAPAMVPHLSERPVNLQRFPGGIAGGGFFQQEMPDYFPDWIAGVTVAKEGGELRHVMIDDAATLVYLANQDCITPHAWLSRADALERPDRMVFDLDPPAAGDPLVRHAALRLGALLHELGLPTYVKTSGSRGYHVTVPLDRSADFDTVRAFAQDAAALLARYHDRQLTVEPRKAARAGRIYIDTLRNSYAHTVVPPYAVRARPGAPVATPIGWDELEDAATRPDGWTLRTVRERLAAASDPWRGMAARAVGLDNARARLDVLLRDDDPVRAKVPRRAPPHDTGPIPGAKPSVRSPGLTRFTQPGPPR